MPARIRLPRPITHGACAQVWIKPNGEMPFLYGNHVVKAHLGRITEDTPEHQGVVVFSMSDVPLVSRFAFFHGPWLTDTRRASV